MINLNLISDIEKPVLNKKIKVEKNRPFNLRIALFEPNESLVELNKVSALIFEKKQGLEVKQEYLKEYDYLRGVIKSKKEEDLLNFMVKQKKRLAYLLPILLKEFALREPSDSSFFLLETFKKAFEKGKQCLRSVSIKKTHTLQPEGVKIVVDYLTAKGALKVPCLVCQNILAFESELKRHVDDPVGTKLAFIVRCQHPETNWSLTNHTTPIFMEKGEKGWKAINTDAAGSDCAVLALYCLREVIPDIVIYEGGSDRQRTCINCSVFALHDLVYFSQHPDIFAYIHSKSTQAYGNNYSFETTSLPPEMMIVTQNEQLLKEYQKINQNELASYILKMAPVLDSQTFAETLQNYTYQIVKLGAELKEVNNFIQEKALKYQRVIVKALIIKRMKKI